MSVCDTDIVVVGAGPAGLMAAIAAARRSRQVLVLDRMDRPGVKLLATGGGRCNLTNTLPTDAFMARFGRFGRFMAPALTTLDRTALLDFFTRLGVPTHCPDGFHVFPVSEAAADVQSALHRECTSLGVRFRFRCPVAQIVVTDGHACGVDSDQGVITARRVLLAAGGCSYPALGADGSGFRLASESGHRVKPALPALVPLIVREPWIHDCAGTTFENAEVWIDLPRRRGQRSAGALLFTHQGISGPAVLDLSGDVAEQLERNPELPLRFACRADKTAEDWSRQINAWRCKRGARRVHNLLDEHLPVRFAKALCTLCGAEDVKAANLTATQADCLREALAGCLLHVTATEGFPRAMVTRGGVSLSELRPETLESRRVQDLFFAGEVVDLDGPCGGYNLQWAFSSGTLAGRSAAG